MVWRQRLAKLILFVILMGCGVSIDPHEVEETTGYPGVVKLTGGEGGLCTGALITQREILSAFHCVKRGGVFHVMVGNKIYDAELVDHLGTGTEEDVLDLAILRLVSAPRRPLPEKVIPDQELILLGGTVEVGENVRLVGFGPRRKGDIAIKRTGTNTVARINHYIEVDTPLRSQVALRGGLTQAGGTVGDSGGPLLKETAQGLIAVGVAHSGTNDNPSVTSFVNLSRPEILRFLRSAKLGLSRL